jgi:hypothetical protein
MKVSSASAFGVFRKYERVADLILAYVWHLSDPAQAVTYAMTNPQARALADVQGWTATAAWETGGYTTSKPSRQLMTLLEPYRMGPGRWWELVTGTTIDIPVGI